MRGVSLRDISDHTKISVSILTAIEEDNLEELPHPTYVKGFIRSYCKMLGLDENEGVLNFEAFLFDIEESKKTSLKDKFMREISVAKAGIGDEGEGRGGGDISYPGSEVSSYPAGDPGTMPGTSHSSGRSIPFSTSKGTARGSARGAGRGTGGGEKVHGPMSGNPLFAGGLLVLGLLIIFVSLYFSGGGGPDVGSQGQALPGKASVSEVLGESEGSGPLTGRGALKGAPDGGAEEGSVAKGQAKAADKGRAEKKAAPVESHRLLIEAKDITWVRVGIDGKEPIEMLMKNGESRSFEAGRFSLLIGNGGGVDITFNGKRLDPVGEKGEVVGLKLPRKGR